jgi:hypothetical protein
METFEEKRIQYQKQIDKTPSQFESHYELGKLYYEQAAKGGGSAAPSVTQWLQKSAEHLEKADQIKPNSPDNLSLLREVYTMTHDSEKVKGINERLNT